MPRSRRIAALRFRNRNDYSRIYLYVSVLHPEILQCVSLALCVFRHARYDYVYVDYFTRCGFLRRYSPSEAESFGGMGALSGKPAAFSPQQHSEYMALYSVGVIPVACLNLRMKYAESS